MDADRFDGLARSLTRYASRRGFLGVLLASAVAIHSPAGSDVAWAKPGKGKAKGHKKGKAKGKAKGHGNGGGQGTATDGSGNSAVPAAASLSTECSLPAESCDGCCQDGQCRPGTDHQSCGHGGMACQSCTAQAMICTVNRECGCDPATCGGCCVTGVCHTGDRDDSCGRGGIVCHSCPTDYVCRQGVCCGEEGAATASAPLGLPYAAACCEGLLPDPAGICHRGCAGLGCPDESECCPSTGECFSRDKTNCRRGDGSLFQCEAGFVCCQSPDGNVECGRNGRDGCPAGFVQALPATCLEWVVQPGAADGF